MGDEGSVRSSQGNRDRQGKLCAVFARNDWRQSADYKLSPEPWPPRHRNMRLSRQTCRRPDRISSARRQGEQQHGGGRSVNAAGGTGVPCSIIGMARYDGCHSRQSFESAPVVFKSSTKEDPLGGSNIGEDGSKA
ncbi:unnamed protein product [Ectocarpus sp. 13 AM-2016]